MKKLFFAIAILTSGVCCAGALPDRINLEGNYAGHLQDFWWDGGDSIWWAHTHQILRTDLMGHILAKADVEDHNAGCEVKDGVLYVAVCALQSKTGGKTLPNSRVQINEYDAKTLALLRKNVLPIHDRAGSFCILPDGTKLVGCLRPEDISKSQVRFHHLGKDNQLIGSHVIGNLASVRLGIEVIRRKGDEVFLFMYGGPVVVLDAVTLKEKGRLVSKGGELGIAFDEKGALVGKCARAGALMPNGKSKYYVSHLKRIEGPQKWAKYAPIHEVTWQGEKLKEWRVFNQAKEGKYEAGVISYIIDGGDSSVALPKCDFETLPTQVFRIKMRSNASGACEIFWHFVGEESFKQRFSTAVNAIGDGTWRTYEIAPYWPAGRRVKALRFDAPLAGREGDKVEIAEFSVVNSGGGMVTELDAKVKKGVSFKFKTEPGMRYYTLAWTTDLKPGLCYRHFRTAGDGKEHTYWNDLSLGNNYGFGDADAFVKDWRGRITWFGVVSRKEHRALPVTELSFTEAMPDLPPDVLVDAIQSKHAVPRTGRPLVLEFFLRNLGTTVAKDARIEFDALSPGLQLKGGTELGNLPASNGYDSDGGYLKNVCTKEVTFEVAKEGTYALSGRVTFANGAAVPFKTSVEVLPSLGLQECDYVPEPKPVSTAPYEIGALCFPGWNKHRWDRIRNLCPERKPVLGWYDESSVEIVDWQIKWLVENGISYLFVDGYWTKGKRGHEGWIRALQKAKWRKYIKWAFMWTNEGFNRGTGKGGKYSEADFDALVKIWTTEFFNTPEYYTIEGKPVLVIYNPPGLDLEVEKGNMVEAVKGIRRRIKAAGFKDVYLVGLRMPSNRVSAPQLARYKAAGFDETCVYHYLGEKAMGTSSCAHEAYAEAIKDYVPHWQRLYEASAGLPFLPCLSTGWDDRPWHGDKGGDQYGRTPALYAKLCRQAKDFADAHNMKRFLMGPLNEWGEGSYAEPCHEFGFGMYEVIRETFGKKPEGGWATNITPEDVGLGNYPPPVYKDKWD